MVSWTIEHGNWDPSYEAYDISWDIWLSNNDNLPSNGTPDLEFMIFLSAINDSPAGSIIDSASNICGQDWNIYKGNGGTSAPLYSWLLKNQGKSLENCNLNDIFQYMQTNHAGVFPKYIIGNQAGQEINQGTGWMNNTQYSLSIS